MFVGTFETKETLKTPPSSICYPEPKPIINILPT